MRYAIFSDIHSNLEAYEAVLEAIEKEEVCEYYCCGDIVGYGADPTPCINKTRQLNPRIVAGNHDWGSAGLRDLETFTKDAKEAVLWTTNKITEEDKDYLKTLGLVYKNDLSLVHGSPNRPEEFEYVFDLGIAYRALLAMDRGGVCFIGHTHAPGVFVADEEGYVGYNPWSTVKIENGKKYLINVGSVGQPRDGDPRAAYCIYDIDSGVIEIKRIKYDVWKAQEKIIKSGLPRILAERLSLGK